MCDKWPEHHAMEETKYLVGNGNKESQPHRWRVSICTGIFYSVFISAFLVSIVESIFILQNNSCVFERQLGVGHDVNGIVPPSSTSTVIFDYKTEKFVPGPNDSAVTTEIWENWTKLLPVGNGVINIPDFRDFPELSQPIRADGKDDEDSSRFSTAWVHQLHCLFFVMKEYHRVLHHGPDGSEYYIDSTHNSYHASHCFNYLRQSILCSMDSTLEGSGEGSGAADGSGQLHICRSQDAVISWLESNRWDDTHAIDNI